MIGLSDRLHREERENSSVPNSVKWRTLRTPETHCTLCIDFEPTLLIIPPVCYWPMTPPQPALSDTFRTVAEPCSDSMLVSGSKFIAWLAPLASEGDTESCMTERKRRYSDATHHCWAFRTGRPSISSDFLADDRTRPWHENARRSGVRSSAALPLFNGGRTEGVIIFNSLERGTFTPEFVELLQGFAENVAFALENFDRADEKAKAEKQKDRLAGMFEALSATNEAIMRVKTRAELFELVRQAAVLGGMFASATIALEARGEEP